jgi:hypothetical protein
MHQKTYGVILYLVEIVVVVKLYTYLPFSPQSPHIYIHTYYTILYRTTTTPHIPSSLVDRLNPTHPPHTFHPISIPITSLPTLPHSARLHSPNQSFPYYPTYPVPVPPVPPVPVTRTPFPYHPRSCHFRPPHSHSTPPSPTLLSPFPEPGPLSSWPSPPSLPVYPVVIRRRC